MKVTSVIVLSAIAAIACASHNAPKSQAQAQPGRELYARNRFAQRRGLLDGLTGSLPIAQHAADLSSIKTSQPKAVESTTDEWIKRSDDDLECEDEDDDGNNDGGHPKPPTGGDNGHPKPPTGGDNGHPKPPTNGDNGHGNDSPCACGNDHDGDIDVILKAYLGIVLDASVGIKADILAKIAVKLGVDLKADLAVALELKAIVDAKIDALISANLSADIRAKVDALVHSRCQSTCGADVDAGILADITAAVKVDLGNLLADIDADILVDLKVRLDALGLKIKANVDVALGLNLRAIVGGVVGDCEDSKAAILADIKVAVLANL
ncbi:hypothetical protein BGZ90_000153 [Linnemannia elongata]|nr:hypothetical protein BGZ90_000153 [Linnemannia elongata]